jgi:hypothetical protein
VTGRILLFLQKTGALRGLRGGSRAWTAIWVTAFALRQVRKRTGRSGEEVVFRQELEPGESFIVTHTTETYG